MSREIDKRVKKQVTEITGKADYQFGDLTAAAMINVNKTMQGFVAMEFPQLFDALTENQRIALASGVARVLADSPRTAVIVASRDLNTWCDGGVPQELTRLLARSSAAGATPTCRITPSLQNIASLPQKPQPQPSSLFGSPNRLSAADKAAQPK